MQHINRIIKPDLYRLCTFHTIQDVCRIRSALLWLTKNGSRAQILQVAEAANVSDTFVKYCYEVGLLKGYHYSFGYDGGFSRGLYLVIDNTIVD